MSNSHRQSNEIEVKPGHTVEEALAQAASQPLKRLSIQGAV